jgi:hypothetical protein
MPALGWRRPPQPLLRRQLPTLRAQATRLRAQATTLRATTSPSRRLCPRRRTTARVSPWWLMRRLRRLAVQTHTELRCLRPQSPTVVNQQPPGTASQPHCRRRPTHTQARTRRGSRPTSHRRIPPAGIRTTRAGRRALTQAAPTIRPDLRPARRQHPEDSGSWPPIALCREDPGRASRGGKLGEVRE